MTIATHIHRLTVHITRITISPIPSPTPTPAVMPVWMLRVTG